MLCYSLCRRPRAGEGAGRSLGWNRRRAEADGPHRDDAVEARGFLALREVRRYPSGVGARLDSDCAS
jgi:hypothetical protein